MWIPKVAVPIEGRRLFAARHLLKEIRLCVVSKRETRVSGNKNKWLIVNA